MNLDSNLPNYENFKQNRTILNKQKFKDSHEDNFQASRTSNSYKTQQLQASKKVQKADAF